MTLHSVSTVITGNNVNHSYRGGKVAVVFDCDLPKTFKGFEVIDGNVSDDRYNDKTSSIIGLHYHPVANDYHYDRVTKKRVYKHPNNPFIVRIS